MNRRLYLLTATLFFSFAAQAQVGFGFKAGYSRSKMEVDYLDLMKRTEAMPNFHGGFLVDIPLGEHFSVQPALMYTSKGARYTHASMSAVVNPPDIENKVLLHYVELPVNFLYHFNVGGGRLFAGAGGYLARGIDGSLTMRSAGWSSRRFDIQFKDGDRQAPFTTFNVKPMDAGLIGMIGYEWKGILLSAGYSHGLTDIMPEGDGGADGKDYYVMKNRQWSVSVGYVLRRIKDN